MSGCGTSWQASGTACRHWKPRSPKKALSSQVQALERKKLVDEACGQIETVHSGYLGAQDTFHMGTLKGVGGIYQQTYVDIYCKVARTKLYTTRRPLRQPVC